MKKIYKLMIVSLGFTLPLVSHAIDLPCHSKYDGMQQKVVEQDNEFAQAAIWQNGSSCTVSELVIRDSNRLQFKINGQIKVMCLSGITGTTCTKSNVS